MGFHIYTLEKHDSPHSGFNYFTIIYVKSQSISFPGN